MKNADPLLEKIETVIAPTINAMGFNIVRLQFVNGPKITLQIMAENAEGRISIDDCARISQAASALLDVEDLIAGEYLLEVSSPGLDRPLTKPNDYERFVGQKVKIKLHRPTPTGRKNFSGTLISATAEDVDIDIGGESPDIHKLHIEDIANAHLVITDDLIRADLKQADLKQARADDHKNRH